MNTLPSESKKLADIASNDRFAIVDGPFGTQLHANEYVDEGIPLVRVTNTSFEGKFVQDKLVFITEKKAKQLERSKVIPGDIVVAKTGATIGKSSIFPSIWSKGIIASSCIKITVDAAKADNLFVGYLVQSYEGQRKIIDGAGGSTRTTINTKPFGNIEFSFPPKPEQAKIAEVLSKVDQAIEQTESLIAKQQRIKTGLMQDLLTRGIDEHGNLRSEETHQFKDSPLGRIPVDWEVNVFGDCVESAVDGPFGSNLKTEHYVDEPGVRVLRLQNIGNGEFIDDDKAWVSLSHAQKLAKHASLPGDILIGSLGDEKRLYGRACLYPVKNEPAIVKADVFRIRCKNRIVTHGFVFRLFNLQKWRSGLVGLAQGVTRDRVNLSNLMLFKIPVPQILLNNKILLQCWIKQNSQSYM